MNRKKSKKKCLSKKSQLHTDIQKTDEERLLELFTDVPYTPAAVRNTVGSHFVKRFMDIMTSPKAVEADWFALCGYMTSTQSQQYMHVTGDYAACKHELNILAIDIANHFQSQLIQLILNDIEGKRSLGIANLFERLHDLLYFRFEPIKGYQTYGHSLGMNFIMQVMSLIGVDLIYISINKNQNNTVRDGAQMFVERARTVFQKAFGIDFAGVQFYNEMCAYRETLNTVAYGLLRVVLHVSPRWTEADMIVIRENNMLLLEYIKKEIAYKKVNLITLHESYPQIIVVGEDPQSGKMASGFATVRINFNSEKISFPEFRVDKFNFDFVDYGILRGIVNLSVNEETGDLCFITGGLPVSLIMPGDYYLALQKFVLRGILRYLENKESDIEDLFVFTQEELNTLEESSLEIADNECKVEQESWWKTFESKASVQATADSDDARHKNCDNDKLAGEKSEGTSATVLPKHLRKAMMDKISGASAPEILSAFRRMFGGEERVRGSHIFFRSPRNGVALPVPRSSGISNHSISPRIILANLEKWGYSPMELAYQLGMEFYGKFSLEAFEAMSNDMNASGLRQERERVYA